MYELFKVFLIFHLTSCEILLQIQFSFHQNRLFLWLFHLWSTTLPVIFKHQKPKPAKTWTQIKQNKTANKTHPELTNYSLMIQTSVESQLILFNFTHPYHSLGFFYSRCFGFLAIVRAFTAVFRIVNIILCFCVPGIFFWHSQKRSHWQNLLFLFISESFTFFCVQIRVKSSIH